MATTAYLSYDRSTVPDVELDPRAEDFVASLRDRSVQLSETLMWRSYEDIEAKIMRSGAFIAVIDPAWTSSTWRNAELTFAVGETALPFRTEVSPSLPSFIYNPSRTPSQTLAAVSSAVILLPDDPLEAAEAVATRLNRA